METILPSWEEIGQGFEARTLEFHDASAYWHGLPVHLHGVPGKWELKRYNAPVDSIEDSAWSCLVTLALQAGGKEGLGIVTPKAAAIYWLERLRVTADYKVTRKVKHKQIKDGQITKVFEASARLCFRLHSKNVVQHCVSDNAAERLSKCATFWEGHLKKLHKRGLIEKYRYDWERAADLLVARALWPTETRTVIDPSEDGLWVKFGNNYFPVCSIQTLAKSALSLGSRIKHADTRNPTARLVDQIRGLIAEVLDEPDRTLAEILRWDVKRRESGLLDEEFQRIISRVPCDPQARARQESLEKEFVDLARCDATLASQDKCLRVFYNYTDPTRPYGTWGQLEGGDDHSRALFERVASDSGNEAGRPNECDPFHYWLHSALIGQLWDKRFRLSHVESLNGRPLPRHLFVASASLNHWRTLMAKATRRPAPNVSTAIGINHASLGTLVVNSSVQARKRGRPAASDNCKQDYRIVGRKLTGALQNIKERKALSYADIGGKLSVTEKSVSNMLTGCSGQIKYIDGWAEILEISVDEIFEGTSGCAREVYDQAKRRPETEVKSPIN